jgi:tetratricopeptide (TPR) repeat protein
MEITSNIDTVLWFNKTKELEPAILDFTKVIEQCEIEIESEQNSRQKIMMKLRLAKDYNNRGKAHHNSKEYKKAIADFTKAIELHPNNSIYYRNRGQTYFSLKEFKKCSDDYETKNKINLDIEKAKQVSEIEKTNSQTAKEYNTLGDKAFNLKQYENAIQKYCEAIKLEPRTVIYYINRSKAYMALKKYEDVISDYTTIAVLDSEKSAIYYNEIGLIYYSLQKYFEALKSFEKAIEIDPLVEKYYNNRGKTYFNYLKQYNNALRDFTQAIELNEYNASSKEVIYFINRADTYRNLKKYKEALIDYNTVIDELNCKDAVCYNNRGVSYSKLKRYREAIDDYNNIINKFNPKDAIYYNNRGLAYYKLDEYKKAITDFSAAIKLNTHKVDYYNNRGLAYLRLAQRDKLALDKKNYRFMPNIRRKIKNFFIAQNVKNAINDFNKIIEHFKKTVNESAETEIGEKAKQANVYNNRSNAYYALGELKKASQDCKEVKKLDPTIRERNEYYKNCANKQTKLFDTGEEYYNKSQFAEAISCYQSIIKDNKETYKNLLNCYQKLGDSYYKLGNFETAIEQYKKAIEWCVKKTKVFKEKITYANECITNFTKQINNNSRIKKLKS